MRRGGYVLLETVIATGLLILGLTVLGAQIQTAQTSTRKMERQLRAIMLAEMQLAQLDTGLIEIDLADEVEEDFGPRYQDHAWRLTTEETVTEDLFRLTLEILYKPRENYDEEFEYDDAEVLYTLYAFRAIPRPLNFTEDFGLSEEEMEELSEKLEMIGIDGLDPASFDLTLMAKLDSEELIEVLPLLAEAFGLDLTSVMSALPPEVVEALREEGLLDMLGGDEEGSNEGGF